METSLFCSLNLLGLVKCLVEFLLRLSTGKTTAEKMTAKPSAKIMFNALAPLIITTQTPQVCEILDDLRFLHSLALTGTIVNLYRIFSNISAILCLIEA